MTTIENVLTEPISSICQNGKSSSLKACSVQEISKMFSIFFSCSIFLIGSQYSYHIYAVEHFETIINEKSISMLVIRCYACTLDQQTSNGFIDENLTTKRNCCMRANSVTNTHIYFLTRFSHIILVDITISIHNWNWN